jgi:AcrR family transcriptional regulator
MVQMNKRSGLITKQKILGAALQVFSTYGYAGANIRAIAKAAGISIGGVYLYFRNKKELYLELIKSRIEDQDIKTKEIVSSEGSAVDALNLFISLHLEYGIKNKELILINIREHGFSFGLEIKRKFFLSRIKLLVNIISKGIRDGEFRACNTEEAARIIMATLRGLVLSMVIEGESIVSEKGLGALILKGLVRSETENLRKSKTGEKKK